MSLIKTSDNNLCFYFSFLYFRFKLNFPSLQTLNKQQQLEHDQVGF